MGFQVPATRITLRADGEEAETPLRMTLEIPGDDLQHGLLIAIEAFDRLGCLHPAVDRVTVVAHVVEPPAEEEGESS